MWKDLDILTQNIENLTQNTGPSLPFQFSSHPTKPATIVPFIKNIDYSANISNGLRSKFLINSTGFLDPYFLFLEVTITNNNRNPVYVEKNYLQLIEKISITTNGNVIEEIDKADYINDLLIDLNLNKDDLDRFYHFGFYSTIPPVIAGTVASVEIPIANAEKNVQNGVTSVYSTSNEKTIIIPIPSRYFGCGQDFNSYKFIPLERFPNLEIEIHLTKSPFLKTLVCSNYAAGNRNELENSITLRINKLITRQMYFDSSAFEYVKKYYKGDLVLENTQYAVSTISNLNAALLEKNDMIMHHRQSLKKIYYNFYIKRTPQSNAALVPKYFRTSAFVKEIQAKCADDYYPETPIKGSASSNSGLLNNTPFLIYSNNSHYVTISNQMKHSINSTNFALTEPSNINSSDFAAFNINSVNNLSNYFYHCENTGKATFCFDFESIPFSGMLFRNGIDTRFNRPVFINIKFDTQELAALLGNYTLDIVPILEFDSILKVSENGYITKEF